MFLPRLRQGNTLPELLSAANTRREDGHVFSAPRRTRRVTELLPNFVQLAVGLRTRGSSVQQRSALVSLQTVVKTRGSLRPSILVQKPQKNLPSGFGVPVFVVGSVCALSASRLTRTLQLAMDTRVTERPQNSNVLVAFTKCGCMSTGQRSYYSCQA